MKSRGRKISLSQTGVNPSKLYITSSHPLPCADPDPMINSTHISNAISILTMMLGSITHVAAQEPERHSYHVESIEVSLKGSTNVNKFNCNMDIEPLKDMHVEVLPIKGGFEFIGVVFNLPSSSFKCDKRLMTKEMHQLLQVDAFPDLILEVKNFHQFEATAEDDFRVSSDVTVTICDQMRDEVFTDCYWKRRGDTRSLGGYHEIQLTDYSIDPPKKMLGAVVTRNTIGLEFEIKLTRDR